MLKMCDTDGKNDSPSCNGLSVIHRQLESLRHRTEVNQKLVFKLRGHAVLKSHAIGCEGVQVHRDPRIAIRDPPVLTKLLERKSATRVVDVRRETIRLKEHTFGHMRLPAVH